MVERPFCIREAEGSNPSMSIFLPYFVDYFLVGPVNTQKYELAPLCSACDEDVCDGPIGESDVIMCSGTSK